MCFAASGSHPVEAGSTEMMKIRIQTETPSTARLPHPLQQVVSMCLEKNPELRPTAEELVDLLTRSEVSPDGDPESMPSAVPFVTAPTGAPKSISPWHNKVGMVSRATPDL